MLRIVVCLFIFLCQRTVSCQDSVQDLIDKAASDYSLAVHADSASVRNQKINAALKSLLALAEESPGAELCYNIGNCYFELQEYGLAILYYEKALEQSPRNSDCIDNLNVAKVKAGLDDKEKLEPFWLDRYLPVKANISLYEREVIYLIGLSVWLGLAIGYQWLAFPLLKRLALGALSFELLLLLSIVWSLLWAPLEGILIQGCGLFQNPGKQSALVRDKPVLAGTKVIVLRTVNDGKWYYVRLGTQEEGYISQENLRLVADHRSDVFVSSREK